LQRSLRSADVQIQNSSNDDARGAKAINSSAAPPAVREYLDRLDEAVFGAATTVTPKFTARCRSATQWTAARKVRAFFA
jgi:hypothetical protein